MSKVSGSNPIVIFEGIFRNHLSVIQKFGRFPHRNDILGRTTTEEEEEFLGNPKYRFDLPLVYRADGTIVFEENEHFVEKIKKTKSKMKVKVW